MVYCSIDQCLRFSAGKFDTLTHNSNQSDCFLVTDIIYLFLQTNHL